MNCHLGVTYLKQTRWCSKLRCPIFNSSINLRGVFFWHHKFYFSFNYLEMTSLANTFFWSKSSSLFPPSLSRIIIYKIFQWTPCNLIENDSVLSFSVFLNIFKWSTDHQPLKKSNYNEQYLKLWTDGRIQRVEQVLPCIWSLCYCCLMFC